ncbi:MAG TPA: hypothetical protein VEF72_28005 [Mycobacterium sp.]|nr:hypothetical protein [Mycobacterium sp.]
MRDNEIDQLQRVMVELERLRNADANLYGQGRPHWEAKRRLVIVAACCDDREPLVEVMNTDPPCVLVGQVVVSGAAVIKFVEGEPRRPWQGIGRARGSDSQGPVWLSTFERQTHPQFRGMRQLGGMARGGD